MSIDELIAELKRIRAKEGNLPVYHLDREDYDVPTTSAHIYVEPEEHFLAGKIIPKRLKVG